MVLCQLAFSFPPFIVRAMETKYFQPSRDTLASDLKRLAQLAFRRLQRVGPLLKNLWHLLDEPEQEPNHPHLRIIKEWLLIPFSLWPIEFAGLGAYVCQQIAAGKKLDAEMIALLEGLHDYPLPSAQKVVAAREHGVEKGEYDPFIRNHAKYELMEKALLKNPALQKEWAQLKQSCNVDKLRNERGVIRRRMVMERNLRPPDWQFRWETEQDRFLVRFDAFCYRWNLYGMEHDKPLLLKPTVTPTPFGTMIFIPRYLSLDYQRDFNWRNIRKLHETGEALRQGEKWSETRLERQEQSRLARAADQQARKKNLAGDARFQFIIEKLGLLPQTDPRVIRRLLSMGRGGVAI